MAVMEINHIVGALIFIFIAGVTSLLILMLIDMWLGGVFSEYLTEKLEKKLNRRADDGRN